MMTPASNKKQCILKICAVGIICSIGAMFLFFENQSPVCPPVIGEEPFEGIDSREKPIVLLWFWPIGTVFDFKPCADYFKIDSCILTADRSLYSKAQGIIFYHKNIVMNWGEMPKDPRPPFQKWIWYNVESPRNTWRRPAIENLFNLTMSYRRDADITVRNELTIKDPGEKDDFVLPKKDKLVCWVVSNGDPNTGAAQRNNYYRELSKHIKVDVYGKYVGRFLRYEDYYPTLGSCKFYLSFENSLHREYITEKVNGPLVAGAVPVVMGPPREQYEQFLPSEAFIHVNDFPNAKSLADFLVSLDKNDEAYMRYHEWRKYYKATAHLQSTQNEFIHPVCLACDHIARDRDYHKVNDINKWFFESGA